MDRSALHAMIANAFAEVKRDPEQTLHQAHLTDQGFSREIRLDEWRLAGLRDVETNWSTVPGGSIDECTAALSHATPASWHFYLPAFMCRALVVFGAQTPGTALPSSVIFHLTYRSDAGGMPNEFLLERYRMLSGAQFAAVRAFLEYMEQEALRLITATNEYMPIYEDAKFALTSYWSLREVAD